MITKKSDKPILEGIYKFFVPDKSAYSIAVEKHSRSVSKLRDEVRAISNASDKIGEQCDLDSELLALQKIERKLLPGSAAMHEVQFKMKLIRFRMKLF